MLPSLLTNYESRFPAYRTEISEGMAEGFYSSDWTPGVDGPACRRRLLINERNADNGLHISCDYLPTGPRVGGRHPKFHGTDPY